MGSCRTFGGAHPSSSIGNGPPAPHRALQLVARERRSVRVLCWLLRLSRAVTPEVNPALFGHAPRDSARADQSTPPTYRHHALAHGANRRGSEHERPLVQHGAPCRSLGATTCHPRRAYSPPIQWPAIIAATGTAPSAPLSSDEWRAGRPGTTLSGRLIGASAPNERADVRRRGDPNGSPALSTRNRVDMPRWARAQSADRRHGGTPRWHAPAPSPRRE